MSPEQKAVPILKKQPVMRKVILALLPCVAGSVYFFGWRSLALVAASWAAGFLAEYAFCRNRREPVSEAVFVTATIYALILPPTVPWHVLVIGIVFAVVFSKEVFGGFGRNVFNPAMAGRCFVYVCFPVAMTAVWAPAAQGPWGALGLWSTASLPDAVTSATPMALAIKGLGDVPPLADLFFGRLSGSVGVTSTLLILIGGVYLYATKTANRSIILTVILVYAGINELLYRLGVDFFPGALAALMGGGFLFGAFFMATDPVSAPATPEAKIAYAVLISVFTAVISNYSVFNGGFMFALLLANMFAPIMDHVVKERKKKRKAAAAGAGGGGRMSLRERSWYPVLYMFVVTAFFSAILIGLSRFTRDRVEMNQRIAFERAVLEALPLGLPEKTASPEVHRLFVERVASPSSESGGAFVLMRDGQPAAFALPVEGRGFWDMIRGVVGIDADRRTLTGISFYEQNETPGLGAEITHLPFRSQFEGKRIAPEGKPLRILPVGSRLGPSDVHAVTGATQTSTRLERFLDEALSAWRAEADARDEERGP